MSVSIKDIAQAANVSPSTVSRALQNHPRISEETRQVIHALASEMGYVPNVVARNLVAQRSATIGVAATNLADPYYARLLLGIEETAVANDYQVLLSSFYFDPLREEKIIRDFHERRLDGIIVTGSMSWTIYQPQIDRYFMPIVVINTPAYPYSVSVDRFIGAKQAVAHLLELNHRRIAFIAWGNEHPSNDSRLQGYRAALVEFDVAYDPSLVITGGGTIAGGIKAVAQLLILPQKPTAVFCFNDLTAIGVVNALRQNGYDVPSDVSVVGFDDLEMAQYHFPPLTTIRQPTYRLGETAVQMLLKLINGEDIAKPEMLAPKLVVRGSTARLNPASSN